MGRGERFRETREKIREAKPTQSHSSSSSIFSLFSSLKPKALFSPVLLLLQFCFFSFSDETLEP
ncbi:hypothetical protein LR48_Vigan406s001700 [Vigna angularis]|uniref:Uncharacterized protein n=1 Tax=Phaseolus angularis TaxID=3914 RepID=A0A0L9T9G9_PHAAN|nr:hypothetical protein LR48_Vigan406s001700 [Vigna angularis]